MKLQFARRIMETFPSSGKISGKIAHNIRMANKRRANGVLSHKTKLNFNKFQSTKQGFWAFEAVLLTEMYRCHLMKKHSIMLAFLISRKYLAKYDTM